MAASLPQADFLRGVHRHARERGWHLQTDMLHTGTLPRGWRGEGVLALVAYEREIVEYLRKSDVPSVAVALNAECALLPRVEADHPAIGQLAAQHLLDRGFRSFAWAPFINDRYNQERLQGFESALREHHCTCRHLPAAHRRIGGYWHDDWAQHRSALISDLLQLPRPTAIFAYNDCVAADLATACEEAGLLVPENIAILGAGNDALECDAALPLSSVDCNLEAIAYHAAELLEAMIEGAAPPEVVVRVKPTGVVARASTRGGTASQTRLGHALSYIADQYPDPLFGVASVADAVGLSRRQLERLFRTAMRCSVREYIERCRMDEALRLLREHPRVKINEIGALVGLSCSGNFFRTFRRRFGVTPTAYRGLQLRGEPLLTIDPSNQPGNANVVSPRIREPLIRSA